VLLDQSIASELDDLGDRRRIGVVQPEGSVIEVADTWGRRPLSMNRSDMRPRDLGKPLADLSRVRDAISRAEREQWLDEVARPGHVV